MHTRDFRYGTLSEEEYGLLRELVRDAAQYDGPIIEVGTLLGGTTSRLPLWARDGQKIITVDNFSWNPWGLTSEQHRSLASQVLYYLSQIGRVELVCKDKKWFYRTYNDGTPALVFLDADHDYEQTKADILWALSVNARIISGHDYCNLFPGVVQAVEEHGGFDRLCGSVWVLNQKHRTRLRSTRAKTSRRGSTSTSG